MPTSQKPPGRVESRERKRRSVGRHGLQNQNGIGISRPFAIRIFLSGRTRSQPSSDHRAAARVRTPLSEPNERLILGFRLEGHVQFHGKDIYGPRSIP